MHATCGDDVTIFMLLVFAQTLDYGVFLGRTRDKNCWRIHWRTQQIASKLQYITVHTKPMPSSTELCVPRNSRLVNLLAAGLYGVHIAVSTQTTNGIGR